MDVLELDETDPGFEWSPVYSVTPRTRAPLIRERLVGGERVCEAFLPTWGLRPSWAKEKGPRPINARTETAAANGMFRSEFSTARALVPMSGHYEWQETVKNGKKIKISSYIHAPDDELLLAARLLAFHRETDENERRRITTCGRSSGPSAWPSRIQRHGRSSTARGTRSKRTSQWSWPPSPWPVNCSTRPGQRPRGSSRPFNHCERS